MKTTSGSKAKNSASVYLKISGYIFVIVYILWSSKEIARLSNDVDILHQTVEELLNDEQSAPKDSIIYSGKYNKEEDDSEAKKSYLHRQGRSVNTSSMKTRSKEKRYLRQCRKKLRKLSAIVKKKEGIEASHVEIDFKVNSTMSRRLASSLQTCFPEYGGNICYNNKTFESGSRIRKADMKRVFSIPWKLSTPAKWSPLKLTSEHGEYKVKYDGLYLVYFNILFIPSQREERVGIFLDEKQIMTCQDGLLFENGVVVNKYRYNLTEKSCSSLGVFIVNKNQILSIRIETSNTQVRLWGVGNNFGVVLLHRQ